MITNNIEEVLLKVGKYEAQMVFDEYQIANMPEVIVQKELGRLVLRVVQKVAREDLFYGKFPLNWKEAFKERWFPKWYLKKHPVKYTVIEVNALYPKISLPDRSPVIKFHKFTSWGSDVE